jgi:hypothetical protein
MNSTPPDWQPLPKVYRLEREREKQEAIVSASMSPELNAA